jgi:hypothetical protein
VYILRLYFVTINFRSPKSLLFPSAKKNPCIHTTSVPDNSCSLSSKEVSARVVTNLPFTSKIFGETFCDSKREKEMTVDLKTKTVVGQDRVAVEMRDYISARTFMGKKIQFRFGINSGSVVAGVIGRKKFIYDLWVMR